MNTAEYTQNLQQQLQFQSKQGNANITNAAMSSNADDKVKKSSSRTRHANRNIYVDRIPKLSVTSIDNGTVINCQMEHKKKTVTFKFDIRDVNPVDVADKLVYKKLTSQKLQQF